MKKRLIHPVISQHYQMIARKARVKIRGTPQARERAAKAARARWDKAREHAKHGNTHETTQIFNQPDEKEQQPDIKNLAQVIAAGPMEKLPVPEISAGEDSAMGDLARERLINELFFGK